MDNCVIIEDFLNYFKFKKHRSEHTINSYAADLRQFADFVITNYDVDINEQLPYTQQYGDSSVSVLAQTENNVKELLLAVNSDLIRKYVLFLDVKQYCKGTVLHKLVCLRSFYKFLKAQNHLVLNPTDSVILPKLTKKLPRVLEFEQVQKLLQTPSMNNWLDVRDRAILEIFYSTGIRTSELVALNIQDVDFLGEVVHIRARGKKERVLPLRSSALQAIQFYMEFRSKRTRALRATQRYMELMDKKVKNTGNFDPKALFVNKDGNRLGGRNVRRKMSKYLEMAGLDQSISPRTLRHSFAIHMLENGTELQKLQELLGHQIQSTTKLYSYWATENHNDFPEDSLEKCAREDEKILMNVC